MSEFDIDPVRICRVKGHQWIKPNPRSSFYFDRKNKNYRLCERCGKQTQDYLNSDDRIQSEKT